MTNNINNNLALDVQIIRLGEKHQIDELQNLIKATDTKKLLNLLLTKLNGNSCTTFWNYLLFGFELQTKAGREKRFTCVKHFLKAIQATEFNYKRINDLISRLCQDLPTFGTDEVVDMLEYCFDGIRLADPKCIGWKDLLPEIMNLVDSLMTIKVNDVQMSGHEYRNTIVQNLYTMRWTATILTPLADMFKEIHLDSNEINKFLHKFSTTLETLTPDALPSLCYQLFSMCRTASHIIVPLLALERYFYRFYYKKLFADMNSDSTDYDTIDRYSDKELREAEETILHHLNYCTQYKFTEIQIAAVLKNFTYMPHIILSPFMLNAILTMSKANRESDVKLNSSILLPYLRNVIKINLDECHLVALSLWCRDSLHRKQVDLEQTFDVLIEQNKEGKDTTTPGLINLIFILLKTKQSPQLHSLAISFLTKFIRKRFVFGQGIVAKLAEWMVLEQDQYQYAECLTSLSVADMFTLSECMKTINYVLECFLWLPGEQSMRMMSFILPILKISSMVRDAFLEILRKAMTSSDVKIRRMSVYGFCMVLKQLNNLNSHRSNPNSSVSHCTQVSVSGFSLMSQATTVSHLNNPKSHFVMLTLEIIGVLRCCFQQPLSIKLTLYENLQRAVQLNPKLVAHILQFIDWHFRSYFEMPSEDDDNEYGVNIKFEQIVRTRTDENDIEILDNLGALLLFVSHCLLIFENSDDEYDVRKMQNLIQHSLEKINAKKFEFESLTGTLTPYKNCLIIQQMNFLEGLIAYCILSPRKNNKRIKYLIPLIREHANLSDGLKTFSNKKTAKSSKTANETELANNILINGIPVKRLQQVENIWDLFVIERLIRLLHEDNVAFAEAADVTPLRSKVPFVRYVFSITARRIEDIRSAPNYKQLSHSKRTLMHLINICRILYENCLQRLLDFWRDFDMESATLAVQCFYQCLQTANETYKKTFKEAFAKSFGLHIIDEIIQLLQKNIDEFMQENNAELSKANESILSDGNGCYKIALNMFHCLEILYDHIEYNNRLTIESYSWLLKLCQTNAIECKELSFIHKLLFKQRLKTHSGAFFQLIPLKLGKIWTLINDEIECSEVAITQGNTELISITNGTAESCLMYLYETIRKQLDDVEHFISKANNFCYKYRMIPSNEQDLCLSALRAIERSICSQLIHTSQVLQHLTNVCLPLGTYMDNLIKLLIQHFVCLKNLAKHFLNCTNGSVKISMQGSKFDLLLKLVGKPLPTNIYALITYIEGNILEERKSKKVNPILEKAKVLRETKFIPKLVLAIENFNKTVIILSKKLNDRLDTYLHFGTVRDFRIKTSDLKAAIERTLSHSSQIENPEDMEDEICNDDDETNDAVDTSEANELYRLPTSMECQVSDIEPLRNENASSQTSKTNEVEKNRRSARNRSSATTTTTTRKTTKTKTAKTHSGDLNIQNSNATSQTRRSKQKENIYVTMSPSPVASSTINDEPIESNTQQNAGGDTSNCRSNFNQSRIVKVNLARINAASTKKRTLRDAQQHDDPDVANNLASYQPVAKKLRGGRALRSSKK